MPEPLPTAVKATSTLRKLLVSVLTVGVIGGAVAVGSYSAFTATATNAGNSIAAGTVAVGRDYSTPFYTVTNAKPGDASTPRCQRITYTGSLTANVKMYISSGAITPSGQWTLKIEKVTIPGANPAGDCTGYTGASTLYNSDLASFAQTYGAGLDIKGGTWTTNDQIGLRVTITQNDDPTVNAHTTVVTSPTHTFTWEAQNT